MRGSFKYQRTEIVGVRCNHEGGTFTMIRRTTAVLAATGLLALAACGSSAKTTAPATTAAAGATTAAAAATTAAPAAATTAAPAATTAAAAATTAAAAVTTAAAAGEFTGGVGCGLNNGKKASGTPIKVGNVTTSVPGIDFTSGPAMMKAYFDCVNDNGGINGRPIQMIMENDNLKPEDAASAARKLIETEKVVAVVGGFSIIDCPVNAKYYAEKGYNVMVAGVPAECFSSPAIAALNMGPGYSALGAAQIVVEKGAKGKMVTITNKTATSDYNNSLAGAYAKSKGMQWEDIQIPPPIADPATEIRNAVQKAGKGGAVVLNFTPPEGLALLKAAEQQGLIDDVVWGSSTPLNDSSVAKALGAAWKGKLNVNAEFKGFQDTNADMANYKAVSAKYNKDAPLGSFQQMGYLIGRVTVYALNGMDPAKLDDPKAVNDAIKNVKGFKNGHTCKPWYFGGLPGGNVPNNTDLNVVPDGDAKMVDDKVCFDIAEVEPILTAVRAFEKK
jgi:branched-chain amino acid transport system substrate-binding protein